MRTTDGAVAVALLLALPAHADVTLHGDAIARWLQVDVDERAPEGLRGEALTQHATLLRRLRLDVTLPVNDAVTVVGRLRLSNEPDEVLRLGPDYLSRPEGSVAVIARGRRVSARAGFFPVAFTPFTLMRWDVADLGLGGSSSGCACAGATSGTLLESLEETAPELTFEGALAAGAVGDVLDWTVLYARPHEAVYEEILPLTPDRETFQHHEDLYAARVVASRFDPAGARFQRVGVTVVHAREDDRNPPVCPGLPDEDLCRTHLATGFGADAVVPLGRRLVVQAEWQRTAHRASRHEDAAGARWANAFSAGTSVTVRMVDLDVTWLRLEPGSRFPYRAITYDANREGFRGRLRAAYRGVSLDLFARRLDPVAREWVVADRVRHDDEMTMSAELAASPLRGLSASAGWQRTHTDVTLLAGAADDYRDAEQDVTQLELRYERDGVSGAVRHQRITEEDHDVALDDAEANITSITVTARF